GQISAVREIDAYPEILRRVVEAEARIMGGLPAQDYTFFVDVGGRGGGLEHLNSCRIALPLEVSARDSAAFFAHEFFHLWNVKRIRPRSLGPFDYIHPPQTRNLWFAEGVTEYYAHVAVRRAGLASEPEFLSHWRYVIRAR